MKIRRVVLTLALLAGGLSRSAAQGTIIFPPGPVTTNHVEIPPGLSTIANPFDNYRLVIIPVEDEYYFTTVRIDNSVTALFPNLPEGTTLYKYDSATDRFSANVFRRSGWSRPQELLNPREGALVFNPSHHSVGVNFIQWYWFGFSISGSPVRELPGGLALIGLPGVLWEIPQPSPGTTSPFIFYLRPFFDPQDGDVVYTFDRRKDRFEPHRFRAGRGWDREPEVADTEAFFVQTRAPRAIYPLYHYVSFLTTGADPGGLITPTFLPATDARPALEK